MCSGPGLPSRGRPHDRNGLCNDRGADSVRDFLSHTKALTGARALRFCVPIPRRLASPSSVSSRRAFSAGEDIETGSLPIFWAPADTAIRGRPGDRGGERIEICCIAMTVATGPERRLEQPVQSSAVEGKAEILCSIRGSPNSHAVVTRAVLGTASPQTLQLSAGKFTGIKILSHRRLTDLAAGRRQSGDICPPNHFGRNLDAKKPLRNLTLRSSGAC
jgi:hypothetical protein